MPNINERLEIVEKELEKLKEKVKNKEEEDEGEEEIEDVGLIFEIFREFKRVLENDVGASLYPNIAKAIDKSR